MPIPIWNFTVIDRAGVVTGAIAKHLDGSFIATGAIEDIAFATAELRKLPRFFTDPELIGAAAYRAWREKYAIAAPTWEQLKEDPQHQPLIEGWIAAGRAAYLVDPTLN